MSSFYTAEFVAFQGIIPDYNHTVCVCVCVCVRAFRLRNFKASTAVLHNIPGMRYFSTERMS
jgi:hypothetical protein